MAANRCTYIAPEGHDFAGHQCGNYAGHHGAHTALIASQFTTPGETLMPQNGEFHWKNGVHFQRLDDGSVQLRIAPFGYDNMREIIPAAEWASIVAHVAGDPASLIAADADRQRMDWLQTRGWIHVSPIDTNAKRPGFIWNTYNGGSFREAVDAARSPEGSPASERPEGETNE